MAQALRKQWAMAEQDQRISETVDREQSRLRNFIRRRVSDRGDAEDILQDVFYELVEAYRVMQPEHVTAWLFQIARNRIIDLFRKKKREAERTGLAERDRLGVAESFPAIAPENSARLRHQELGTCRRLVAPEPHRGERAGPHRAAPVGRDGEPRDGQGRVPDGGDRQQGRHGRWGRPLRERGGQSPTIHTYLRRLTYRRI